MFRFLVLKPLVFEECLVSWFQTPLLQILRVRLGFAVNCSAPFCSFLRNVSSPGADLVFLPFGSVLRFDECLGSWPQFCSFLMNVSAPGANSASAWATPGRVTRRAPACHPPRTPPSYSFACEYDGPHAVYKFQTCFPSPGAARERKAQCYTMSRHRRP